MESSRRPGIKAHSLGY